MTKYRKRPVEPVEIEAVQWDGTNRDEVTDFLGGDFASFAEGRQMFSIRTLHGVMACPIGHWVVRGVNGEHHSWDPEMFAATYEPADAPAGLEE